MANSRELRDIAKARLKSSKLLLEAEDWIGSVYMMALALECTLKAVTCKTLNLESYPENTRNKGIDTYFMTHRFDRLLIVSGMESVFSTRGDVDAFQNWSDFTGELPTEWIEMRYTDGKQWTKLKAQKLYNNLTDPKSGIISLVIKSRKW